MTLSPSGVKHTGLLHRRTGSSPEWANSKHALFTAFLQSLCNASILQLKPSMLFFQCIYLKEKRQLTVTEDGFLGVLIILVALLLLLAL